MAGLRETFRRIREGWKKRKDLKPAGAGDLHPVPARRGLLRFDGLYCEITENAAVHSLRFYPEDNTVLEVSTGNRWQTVVFPGLDWFHRRNRDLSSGTFILEGNRIRFTTVSEYGKIDYWGETGDGYLLLSSRSHINGHEAENRRHEFYAFEDIPEDTSRPDY